MIKSGLVLSSEPLGWEHVVEDKNIVPMKADILAVFLCLSVQVLVPNQRQELVPIAAKDKNIIRLPIR